MVRICKGIRPPPPPRIHNMTLCTRIILQRSCYLLLYLITTVVFFSLNYLPAVLVMAQECVRSDEQSKNKERTTASNSNQNFKIEWKRFAVLLS